MIRRAYIIGIMALGLTASASYTAPVVDRAVSSARSFGYYFQDLKRAGTSMSAVERFVFSLVLTHTKTSQVKPACAPPDRRT